MSTSRHYPPPHDPDARELIARIDGWHVRRFPGSDDRFDYFARNGFMHLQLWHPDVHLSVLTPSRLTMYAYEVFPVGGLTCGVGTPSALCALLGRGPRLETPTPARLRALQRWFGSAPCRRARAGARADVNAARGGTA